MSFGNRYERWGLQQFWRSFVESGIRRVPGSWGSAMGPKVRSLGRGRDGSSSDDLCVPRQGARGKYRCRRGAAGVDFTNFCPIHQQLMSNFPCAVRFSSFPRHRSTASGDILAAIPPDDAPATDGLLERIPQGGRLAVLVGWRRSSGPTLPYDTSPTARALSKARLRVPSDS